MNFIQVFGQISLIRLAATTHKARISKQLWTVYGTVWVCDRLLDAVMAYTLASGNRCNVLLMLGMLIFMKLLDGKKRSRLTIH
ncbi:MULTISPECIES: hypothetical protein [Planktothricoides]|uniref:Transposase n=2 Tax=Planktothricoides raciborskii TaxID=132608 RepID=A0AAU8JDF3_9CYAN|nr:MULTISPECIES: hypothetical protein [Planktothricoides]KOR33702.1 hypothetical protein AM228_28265 [Planktothricoides sp. SR001]MBD2544348.1 hypothetical protein [Planktothricoides raciborskii FACHB-1370]MBD2582195.1 hypothetical protein [Planktothricoides raciborskii FACHB-1261]